MRFFIIWKTVAGERLKIEENGLHVLDVDDVLSYFFEIYYMTVSSVLNRVIFTGHLSNTF